MKIFHNNLNNNSKTITLRKYAPFKKGNIKYLPSFSKEWKNIIYSYNKNNLKNIPVNDININKIIKSYFNLYFKDKNSLYTASNPLKRYTKQKLLAVTRNKKRRNFLRRIYVSNAEIKHTNNKAIITLYTVNRERKILKNKYLKINNKINRHLIKRSFLLYNKISKLAFKKLAVNTSGASIFKNKYKYITNLESVSKKNFLNYKLNYLMKFIKFKNTYLKKIWSLIINQYWNRHLNLLRKYDLVYSLNQYKFNKQIFLPILSNILNKIIRKKIQYNIINLKSITFHTDLFTNALALKIKKQKMNYRKSMYSLLNRACLPIINMTNIQDRSPYKYKDFDLISILNDRSAISAATSDNKTRTDSIKRSNSLLSQTVASHTDIDKLLGNSCNISQVHTTIYNSIGYKNMGGMRLEVKGRLSKRYRADRSQYLLKLKGGLKNVDSSFKGLSSVLFRGNSKSNVSYSIFNSKRRIGAFAVKGWISGK